MKETKQVIIIRKDLKMRRGKEISQGSHSSLAVFFNLMKSPETGNISEKDGTFTVSFKHNSKALHDFMMNRFRKITVYVNSEKELLDIYEKAKRANLLCSLIKDAGLTELKEPTFTAVCIGPDYDENIDPITKDLPLY